MTTSDSRSLPQRDTEMEVVRHAERLHTAVAEGSLDWGALPQEARDVVDAVEMLRHVDDE